jgi:hypothetical protein
MSVRLTKKQESVLNTIIKGNPDGSFCDLDQVVAGVPYETNKPSMQFIIRNLIGKGLIEKKETEKRRSRRRVVLAPTREGYDLVSRKRKLQHQELVSAFRDDTLQGLLD